MHVSVHFVVIRLVYRPMKRSEDDAEQLRFVPTHKFNLANRHCSYRQEVHDDYSGMTARRRALTCLA